MRNRLIPLISALATLVTARAVADERPTLSGAWTASALSERWNIGDWGEACGPKPAPRGAPGGSVQVSESGGELVFSGGGYPRTSGCFEMGGPIGVTSHSASPRFWRTRCGTPAGDPRKATIVTTISATDSSIGFDETGEYQFVLGTQNCTASVRRSRSYTLVKRLGDDPPPAPPTTTTAPPPPPPTATATKEPAANACESPGEAARIEVRPSRKILKPGETFPFRAVVLDAAGCRVSAQPAWSAQSGDGKLTVTPAGVVTVLADAPEGEVTVSAGLQGRAAKVTIEIVSPSRYDKLLSTGTLSAGESEEAAVAVVATSGLGAGAGTAADGSGTRKLIFVGVVGGVVVALGLLGVVLLKRQKPEVEEIEEFVPGEVKQTVVKKKRLVQKVPTGKKCPTCGGSFEANKTYCPNDGARLEANKG